MAYNYTNMEMIPLYGGTMATAGAGGAAAPANVTILGNHTNHHPHHGHFVLNPQVTQSSSVNAPPPTLTGTHSTNTKCGATPSPPPAPKLSDCMRASVSPKATTNQGTAPMDLDNDSENEMGPSTTPTTTATTPTIAANVTRGLQQKCGSEQQQQKQLQTATTTNAAAALSGVHDPNLYLSSLLSGGLQATTTPYMFFQAATANGAPSTAAAGPAAGPPTALMDANAMMAAMQQLQQQQQKLAHGFPGAAAAYAAVDGEPYTGMASTATATPNQLKQIIQTKNCILYPPHPNAPPPTIRDRPHGCRTVFVGGLPESITDDVIREIFESCGEITTLRMSKKNFCHIRFRHESSIDRAIYLSGYRVRVAIANEQPSFGRFHVDYALARDDQYDYECRQRQLQREQRHRERMSLERMRSQSPPAQPHYTDHEASLVADNLRNNETFVKAVQTIAVWLERGDCTKRNAYIFYSMIQSTNAHVKRLHGEKQQLEDELRKSRENYRKQMLTMASQFTQIEKVFNAASHKKVWDHFTKAQRKNIDQWKKMTSVLRAVHIEDDEMEMSDDDRDYQTSSGVGGGHVKRSRIDSDGLKEENDSLRCQLEAMRNEMSLDRSDSKYNSDFREKQIKVLQETIRNMQTQLLQTKTREQKDTKHIEQLEKKLKEAGVRQLLLKTKIKDISTRLKERQHNAEHDLFAVAGVIDQIAATVDNDGNHDEGVVAANGNDNNDDDDDDNELLLVLPHATKSLAKVSPNRDNLQIIDIDFCKSDDDEVKIIEDTYHVAAELARKGRAPKSPDIVEIAETSSTSCAIATTKDECENGNDSISVHELKTDKDKDAENNPVMVMADVEAKIISLATAYLMIHPAGVGTLKIHIYLTDLCRSHNITVASLEGTLRKYANLFKAEQTLQPDNGEMFAIWKFCGFDEFAT